MLSPQSSSDKAIEMTDFFAGGSQKRAELLAQPEACPQCQTCDNCGTCACTQPVLMPSAGTHNQSVSDLNASLVNNSVNANG